MFSRFSFNHPSGWLLYITVWRNSQFVSGATISHELTLGEWDLVDLWLTWCPYLYVPPLIRRQKINHSSGLDIKTSPWHLAKWNFQLYSCVWGDGKSRKFSRLFSWWQTNTQSITCYSSCSTMMAFPCKTINVIKKKEAIQNFFETGISLLFLIPVYYMYMGWHTGMSL